jgi:mono/diheme cytochrome c family protein
VELVAALVLAGFGMPAVGGDSCAPSAERGRVGMTARSFLKPTWGDDVYSRAGKVWGGAAPDPVKEPDAYAAAFNRRYGLNPAPYPNDGLPMGLKRGALPDGTRTGIQIDCLVCHGGSIGGKSYVGLGNTQLDLSRMFDELMMAEGRRMPRSTFVINSARGTVNAGMFSAVLLSVRNPDMSMRLFPLPLGVNLPEMDTPPWWNLRKKTTMYYDGRTPAASVRSSMQFLLGEKSLEELKALEPDFADILAYFKSLTPPRYPFTLDRARAERGRDVFENICARCHGTYGPNGEYPNRIVPLKEIGTDPARALGLSDKLVAHYNSTWLAENHPANPKMTGYQAPPLDGIWATAPYLHNGSVPTLYHLLKSSARPRRFTRPPSTDFTHYDRLNVGWTFEPVESLKGLDAETRRSVFDASRFGLGNGGHTFGDPLSDSERMDLIEYLKTL